MIDCDSQGKRTAESGRRRYAHECADAPEAVGAAAGAGGHQLAATTGTACAMRIRTCKARVEPGSDSLRASFCPL